MRFSVELEQHIDHVKTYLPTFTIRWAHAGNPALGYIVRYQLSWQSQVITRQMDEASLLLWIEGFVDGATTVGFDHLRMHSAEPAAIGTDDATLVVTHTGGLRPDLYAMLRAYYETWRRPPEDVIPPPEVRDLGHGMLALGRYGISDHPDAIVIMTHSDGGYGVRREWDTSYDALRQMDRREGERIVIDISEKLTRQQWDDIDERVATILNRRDDEPDGEPDDAHDPLGE